MVEKQCIWDICWRLQAIFCWWSASHHFTAIFATKASSNRSGRLQLTWFYFLSPYLYFCHFESLCSDFNFSRKNTRVLMTLINHCCALRLWSFFDCTQQTTHLAEQKKLLRFLYLYNLRFQQKTGKTRKKCCMFFFLHWSNMLSSPQIFPVLTARNWWSGIWRWTQDAGHLSLHPTKIRAITRLPGKPTLEGLQLIHIIMRAAGIWSLCLVLLLLLSSVQNNLKPFHDKSIQRETCFEKFWGWKSQSCPLLALKLAVWKMCKSSE